MAAPGQRRIPLVLGILGLVGMALGIIATFHPALTLEQSLNGYFGSLVSAAVAFVCGLLVRGRSATMVLVVPSFAYLAIMLLSP